MPNSTRAIEERIDLNQLKDAVNFYDLALFFNEEKLSVSYNCVKMCCPFHKESTPSFSYHIEKKFFKCFGCGQQNDIFGYVLHKIKSNNFRDAIEFIKNFTGIQPGVIGSNYRKDEFRKQLNVFNKLNKTKENNFTYFNEQAIKSMVDFRIPVFEAQGFLKDTLDFFEVGFDQQEKRTVVPIRDENGVLVGATGRTILENWKALEIPKWRHYKNSNINENLFNINNAISESKYRNGSIIVVEGPKDVMWLHQNGFKNTVACLSNGITSKHKDSLLKNFLSVYLFLDGDKGGENGKSSIVNKIKGYFNIFDVKIDTGKDPDDLTKEELDNAISTAKKIY